MRDPSWSPFDLDMLAVLASCVCRAYPEPPVDNIYVYTRYKVLYHRYLA